MKIDNQAAGLRSLGSQGTTYSEKYDPSLLESFPWDPQKNVVIELECPEFTSLCPKTGQPDFANITIRYQPHDRCVESKSLKLYLFSFRSEGSFHETCVRKIADDLAALLKPIWIEVRGDFMPRGGISINPTVLLPRGYKHD